MPSTETAVCEPGFCRLVAKLGIQAAEGLEHAHQMGVLHRDIKPANLMIDADGHLWIADFGLARLHGETALTMTGDLVGTLRYMSPEQALAQRVLLDHRTDIYSLGVTLYELLTLRPAFDGTDRQELLRRIALDEPALPRRFIRGIPEELETIVLKAMAKSRDERYATAQELADDLQRFLDDRPIRARRPTPLQRLRKWARRNRAVVWAAGTILAVLVLVAAGNWLWLALKRGEAEAAVYELLQQADQWQVQKRWPESLAAAQRARALLELAGGSTDLKQRVEELVSDLKMVRRLEDVRLEQTAVRDDHWDNALADALYAEAFRDYGLDVEALDVAEAAARVRACSISIELTAALDHWALARKATRKQEHGWKHLVAVARAADPDPWRNRFRDAFASGLLEKKALEDLAASAELTSLPPVTLCLLCDFLASLGSLDRAAAMLRKAQQQHPSDFWINCQLGRYYITMHPPQRDEALRFATTAVGIRPQSAGAHYQLGFMLAAKGHADEAVAAYRKAIRLKPDFALAYNSLGGVLCDGKRDYDGAIKVLRKAVRLKKDYALAHYNLGNALFRKGQLNEALAAYREALRVKNDFAEAHLNLGAALEKTGATDEAIVEYREALRLKKDLPTAYYNLGSALMDKRQLDEAIAMFRDALRLQKKYPEAHYNLGFALYMKGDLPGAISAYQAALRLQPDYPQAHFRLGSALMRLHKWEAARAALQKAVDLQPDDPQAQINLAWLLASCPQVKLRDAPRAVELARKALERAPTDGDCWKTLGVASYRADDAKTAVLALHKSLALRKGGNPLDWLFLAMAHGRLGEREQGVLWYTKASQWLQRNEAALKKSPYYQHELDRLRIEAAGIVGVKKDQQ
jgi:tetratricopeptide (TPR) repeat protein